MSEQPVQQNSGNFQPVSASTNQTASTQLEFTQAMTDFKVMFPDMDAEVIEAVLRANNGAVDTTIDHLLTMTADNEAEKDPATQGTHSTSAAASSVDQPPAYSGQPPSYQQATNNEAITDDLINLGGATGGAISPLVSEKTALIDSGGHSMQTGAATSTSASGSVDLLADFADVLGASSTTSVNPSATLEKSPNSGSEVKHAYSHPKRQEADEQLHYQQHEHSHQQSHHQISSHSSGASGQSAATGSIILPTQQQLHEIYEENLRLREEVVKNSTAGSSTAEATAARNQYLEDERIALMLQNEEFMAELQKDSEFMSALEMEEERAFYDQQLNQKMPSKNSSAAKMMDSDEFRDKLKNMGKTSKKKFAQMAAMFSRRKSAAKSFLGSAAAPSKDNLLLHAEPLVNEEDSDTEDFDAKNPGFESRPSHHTQREGDSGGDRGSSGGSKLKTPTKGKYTSFS